MVNGPEAGARNEIRVERHHDYSSIPRLVCKQNNNNNIEIYFGFFLKIILPYGSDRVCVVLGFDDFHLNELTTSRRMSSGTFLEWLQTALDAEWVNRTGALATSSTDLTVAYDTWLRSTIIPSRFISAMTV
jgi:hypothetical protein